jgi:murein DD-endopeptidase
MKAIILLLFFLIAFDINPISAQSYQPSLDIQLQHIPERVIIAGKPTVYYELRLTNFASDTISLEKLEVMNAAGAALIVAYDKDALQKRYSSIGLRRSNENNGVIPGGAGIIYLEVTLPDDTPGLQLTHRLTFKTGQKNRVQIITGVPVDLSGKLPVVLGAPLSNGPWVAIYEPAWQTGHRRVVFTIDGKARIPGRFAIDFVKVDDLGAFAKGNSEVVKNWLGYGNNVLAVADGVVAAARDDFPESATIAESPAYTADKATGNYIAIDIGNSNFVFYEHLAPGSIKVKQGQRVTKGTKIAALGFTGQSTGPHLHLHVANVNAPLGAEGVPFVFEHFTALGVYNDFEKFGKAPWVPAEKAVVRERPASNSVLCF